MDVSILDKVIFDPVTVKHAIFLAAVLFVIFVAAPMIFRKKTEEPDIYETVKCSECGWTGKVSKYHRSCKKCNGTILERL